MRRLNRRPVGQLAAGVAMTLAGLVIVAAQTQPPPKKVTVVKAARLIDGQGFDGVLHVGGHWRYRSVPRPAARHTNLPQNSGVGRRHDQ